MFTRQEKILLAILASIQFSSIVDFMIMMPLGPQLMRIFEINPHQFGLLVSSYTFFAGLSGFAASFFMDKFDRKKSLIFFFVGFGVGTVACGLATSYETLLAARGLTGIFGGVLGSLVMAIVSDAISYDRRGSAMGVVMMSFSLASVLGVPLSLYAANIWGWHSPFLALGVVSLILCGVIWKAVPPMGAHLTGQTKEPIHRTITRIFQNPNQLKALIFMATVIFGHFAVIPFMSPSLVSNAGLTEAQLPLMYMCGGLLTIFTSPLIGKLADKFGKPKVFFWGALLTTIPYFAITHLGPTPVWLVLCFTTFLFVSSGGRMIPASAMVSGTSNPQTRGSFMSIVSCVQQLASALASYIAGIMITKDAQGHLINYDWVGYISIATTFVAMYLSTRLETVEAKAPAAPTLADDSLLH
jgi:DHA1 family inner membrane transport protein